jgi:predicted DNA-binding transcriptional regulator AlpA
MQHKPRPAVPVGGDVLLPTHLVLARYDIVDRTLDRWLADEAMAFPRPLVIYRRRYFRQSEIEAWERHRAAAMASTAA